MSSVKHLPPKYRYLDLVNFQRSESVVLGPHLAFLVAPAAQVLLASLVVHVSQVALGFPEGR